MVSPQRPDDTPFLPAISCVVRPEADLIAHLLKSRIAVAFLGLSDGIFESEITLLPVRYPYPVPKKDRTERSYKANARRLASFKYLFGFTIYSVK